MRSPYTPEGWKYDHIGFVLKDGRLKDMSGHRYDEKGEHPLPPVTYRFEEAEELFEMPKSKNEAIKQKLYKEKRLPKTVAIPDEVMCNIDDLEDKAVNCGSFLKIVLYNNGIQTTTSTKPEEIFNSI